MLLPNDMMLGDADHSGVPDVAVGRFLATDATELSCMVAKTVIHDRKHPWNQAVLVADWDGEGADYFDFSGYVCEFSEELSTANWNTDVYSCSTVSGFCEIWNSFYEVDVRDNLQEGRDLFYYLGHSSDTMIGRSSSLGCYLVKTSDMINADWSYAPLAFGMGCRMGRYTSLDVVNLSSCLMETAVKNPSSGFSAVISSSGYLYRGEARTLTELFSDEVNLYGAKRLGDAWTAVLDQFGAAGLSHIEHTVLLGDPSMPVYKPRYPTVIKLR